MNSTFFLNSETLAANTCHTLRFPSCSAFLQQLAEPWSEQLTGRQLSHRWWLTVISVRDNPAPVTTVSGQQIRPQKVQTVRQPAGIRWLQIKNKNKTADDANQHELLKTAARLWIPTAANSFPTSGHDEREVLFEES